MKMPAEPPAAVEITSDLARRIQAELGQNVYLCYQCVKCTSGCPVGEFFDWQPNQVMRALQLGQEDIAFQSQTPWLCAACQTCTTRCPQDLDIAAIMDFLTREALAQGYKPQVPVVQNFNQAFLREVRLWGRAYEPGLMIEMKLRSPETMLDDIDLYMRMLQKGKVGFFPSIGRIPRNVKPLPNAAQSLAYYPGCSLHTTAAEFNHSTQAVCEALGVQLIEPDGWVCCGSSAAHRADPQAALELPLKNLALIERSGFEKVMMPCAACFNRHQAALHEIRSHPEHAAHLEDTSGYVYQDRVQVMTLVQALHSTVGVEGIAARVKKPLHNLRVVAYYGCLLTRPPEVTGVTHYENPTDMDEVLAALGAEVHDWSYKTSCCGAAHALTRPDIVHSLSGRLIEQATLAGAEIIAVACPLCHLNLDARQFQLKLENPLPILYISQLIALALGLPEKALALQKNMVDPRPLLRRKALLDTS